MGGSASIPTDASKRVQVISAGYSRTGTVSMSLALEKLLDGPILHGGTQILIRDDGKLINSCNGNVRGRLTGSKTTAAPGSMPTKPEMQEIRRPP
jgi:hypothetical protein